MMTTQFEVDISQDDVLRFADLSGDWNPLHTDSNYAQNTIYRRPIIHGAYSAGLVSRVAGMYIPGKNCLLRNLKLKFISPIFLPAKLRVQAELMRGNEESGLVKVHIVDQATGQKYVEGTYEFGNHVELNIDKTSFDKPMSNETLQSVILVVGASGSVGQAILSELGDAGLGISHAELSSLSSIDKYASLVKILGNRRVSGIVNCAWPAPDNRKLIDLGELTGSAISHYVNSPLLNCIKLAEIIKIYGQPKSSLILIGSSGAAIGRHNWKSPLYSLGKSLIPTLVSILAVELAPIKLRCVGVVFDVLDGGMNAGMPEITRMSHIDRFPSGVIPGVKEAAEQVAWLIQNQSTMISGSVVNLSGGAIP
jgi:acyl dehydratase/NAD(P)-dependent dehydrogenase (short-subunit alcohol dehydrogenase family)